MRPAVAFRALTAGLTLALAGAAWPAASTPSPPRLDVAWAEAQPRGGWVAGAADVDGIAGDEVLLSSWTGGFLLAGGDGAVLWRHPAPVPARPSFTADFDGDGAAEVAALTGNPGTAGELVVVSGRTGALLHRRALHSPVGRVATGDLDGDGAADLVVPIVDGRTELLALQGPALATAWTVTLPGQMSAYYVNAESVAVADVDADGRAEVVFATRATGNTGGAVHLLDGRTGALRWTRPVGPAFGVAVSGATIMAATWQPAGLTWTGVLRAVDAAGGPRWDAHLAGYVRAAPLAVADLGGDGATEIVVTTGVSQQGSLAFGLDPSTMAVQAFAVADGTPRWVHKTARDVVGLAAVPAPGGGADIAYGTGAFLSSLRDEDVVLLAGQTGAPRWVRSHHADFGDDDITGLVAADLDGAGGAEVVHGFGQTAFAARSAADGAVQAVHRFPSVWTAAAVAPRPGAEPVVVGGGVDGLVTARDPSGATLWTTAVPGVVAGVAAGGDTITAVTAADELVVAGLDPATGALGWTTPTGVAPNPYSTHQVAWADVDGDDAPDSLVGGGTATEPAVVAVSGRTGAILWRGIAPPAPDPADPAAYRPPTGFVAGLGVAGDVVVAALLPRSNVGEPVNVVALGLADGRTRWTARVGASAADAVVTPLGDAHAVVAFGGRHVGVLRLADGAATATADLGSGHVFAALGERVVAAGTSVLSPETVQVISVDGVQHSGSDQRIGRVAAAAALPGGDVLLAGPTGVFRLDGDALAGGLLNVRAEAHLPTTERTPGHVVEYPGIRQLVVAHGWAVGTSDLQLLNGFGGVAPGAWAARTG